MIFALQIRRTPRELILAGLFSALIAFLLFLIWDFDAPYSRGITASADPFLDPLPGHQGLTASAPRITAGGRPQRPVPRPCGVPRAAHTHAPFAATAIAQTYTCS